MNEDEFSDAKWLSVKEALDMTQKPGKLPLFVPQMILMTTLLFSDLDKSLTGLQIYADETDKSPATYLTNRAHMYFLGNE